MGVSAVLFQVGREGHSAYLAALTFLVDANLVSAVRGLKM